MEQNNNANPLPRMSGRSNSNGPAVSACDVRRPNSRATVEIVTIELFSMEGGAERFITRMLSVGYACAMTVSPHNVQVTVMRFVG
jgi:hypothetical protein